GGDVGDGRQRETGGRRWRRQPGADAGETGFAAGRRGGGTRRVRQPAQGAELGDGGVVAGAQGILAHQGGLGAGAQDALAVALHDRGEVGAGGVRGEQGG